MRRFSFPEAPKHFLKTVFMNQRRFFVNNQLAIEN